VAFFTWTAFGYSLFIFILIYAHFKCR
jgi:hypothetical protein